MRHFRRFFPIFLCAEAPVLLVTLGLLAWALSALVDAHKFVNRVESSNGLETRGYALEYGTQVLVVSYTTTEAPTESTYVTPNGARRAPLPAPTMAPQVRATDDSHWKPRAVEAVKQRGAGSVPSGTSGASLLKRTASWGKDNTYDSTHDGLYRIYDDDTKHLRLWIGMVSVMILGIVCRLVGTVIYLFMDGSARRVERNSGSTKLPLHAATIAVGLSGFAWGILVSCGVVNWVIFARNMGLEGTDVRATIAFWALSCLTTCIVFMLAYIHVYQVSESNKAGGV